MRNWRTCILLLVLLAVCASVTAAAELPQQEQLPLISCEELIFQCGGLKGTQTAVAEDLAVLLDDPDGEDENEKLYEIIYRGLAEGAERIALGKVDYSVENLSMILSNLCSKVVNDHPELFYVTGGFRYEYYNTGEVFVLPIYNEKFDSEAIAAFNHKVHMIINNCIDEEMSDLEKALALHDYLVSNCGYNWEVSVGEAKPTDDTVYSAYGALINGDAVCQGYSLAYQLLLKQVDIDSGMVVSVAMNHSWNWVELDDRYYHVDVTWDDPVPNRPGHTYHTYFLLSDKTFMTATEEREAHYAWLADAPTCDSDKFESGYAFNGSGVSFYRHDGAYYYMREGALFYGPLKGEGRKIEDVGADYWQCVVWMEDQVYYTNLTVDYEGNLYAHIHRCDLKTGVDSEIDDPVLFKQTASQDGKFAAEYDSIGLRLDHTGTKLELVSTNRREALYTASIRNYPVAWDEEELKPGEQIRLLGVDPSADGILVGVLLNEEDPEADDLWVAFYQGGKMVGVRHTQIDSTAEGLQVKTVNDKELPAWDSAMVMLTNEKLAPACPEWRSN